MDEKIHNETTSSVPTLTLWIQGIPQFFKVAVGVRDFRIVQRILPYVFELIVRGCNSFYLL